MSTDVIDSAGEPRATLLNVHHGATREDWEEASGDSRFVELIDGRLVVHSPVSELHARAQTLLQSLLTMHVAQQRLGTVRSGPFTMDLGVKRKFEPDLMYLAEASRQRIQSDRLVGPADLVIEIASPSTRSYDRNDKRGCYRDAGVGEYWIVDPMLRRVSIDVPAGNEIGSYAEGWVASTCCPGFAVRAEWLWADPEPNVYECLEELRRRVS